MSTNTPFDCVVTVHTNPQTCGVARFNIELAKRLGVPLVEWDAAKQYNRPLWSFRYDELSDPRKASLPSLDWLIHAPGGAFYHNSFGWSTGKALPVHCPSAPLPEPVDQHGLRILSFGMAHKLLTPPYLRLRGLLGDQPYTLRLSTALHEGHSLRDADATLLELHIAFGERLAYLGCLSDVALAEELRAADVVAAFFPQGVRANNTTVHMAMAAGKCVITNRDEFSPPEFKHGQNMLDLNAMVRLPNLQERFAIGNQAYHVANGPLGWDALISKLREGSCVTSATGSSLASLSS